MIKKCFSIIILLIIFLSSCIKNNYIKNDSIIKDEKIDMKLIIDEKEINCTWYDNDSVKEINSIKPIEINMNIYGGFEQVGSIGKIIKSDDENITTNPGDIVLYNSSNIVVFFGKNTWSYTKLGHINLSEEELKELLNKPSINLKIE